MAKYSIVMQTLHHDRYAVARFFVLLLLILATGKEGIVLHPPRTVSNVGMPQNNNRISEVATSSDSMYKANDKFSCDRRSIFARALFPAVAAVLLIEPPLLVANAAVDVSGLRPAADTRPENSIILNQIRSYDGSETTRIQEIQKMKAATSSTSKGGTAASGTTSNNQNTDVEEEVGISTYAYRYSTAFQPQMTKVGNYGEKLRFDDQLESSLNKKGFISVSFEFPSDWLQLDKMLGGIQYVDQRNGDKLYVLKVKLPSDANLVTVPKQFFGDAIFHPRGTILRSGITVDEYKVKTSTIISDGSVSIPHRRLLIKYATVTPNGIRTERRAIVDAYEMDANVYMMVTSSNAVKFDANGRERETVEAIADSFRIEKIA
jgi:hypothetical protein